MALSLAESWAARRALIPLLHLLIGHVLHDSPSSRSAAYPLQSLPDGHRFALLLRDVGQSLPRHGFPVIEVEADALLLRDALYAFLLDHSDATADSAKGGERYPLPPRTADELRIASLVDSVVEILPDYGFPAMRSVVDHTRLAGALHGFLYQPKETL
ncbi:hypothetical protein ACIQCG_26120 [Streptomyces noursei]|uniref:hypothetical protein n=1 Tax=Streptomyces noursei TaxID=1971 RepID=UPI0038278B03